MAENTSGAMMGVADQARELLQRNRPAEAVQLLQERLAGGSGSAAEQMLLGVALAQAGKCSAAIEALEQAVTLAPEDAAARFNLGQVYRQAGRSEEALRELDRAVELRPGYAAAGGAAAELRREMASKAPMTECPAPTGAPSPVVELPLQPSGPAPAAPKRWVVKSASDGTLRVRDGRWNSCRLIPLLMVCWYGIGPTVAAVQMLHAGPQASGSGVPFFVFLSLLTLGLVVALRWALWASLAPIEWHVGAGFLEVRQSLLGRSKARRYGHAALAMVLSSADSRGVKAQSTWALVVEDSQGRHGLTAGAPSEIRALGTILSAQTGWALREPPEIAARKPALAAMQTGGAAKASGESLRPLRGVGNRLLTGDAWGGDSKLRAGDEVFALFRCGEASSRARTTEGEWLLARQGGRVTVRQLETGRVVASLRRPGIGNVGALDLSDGRTLRCVAGFLRQECSFRDDAGNALVRFWPSSSFMHNGLVYVRVDVKIEPAALSVPELPTLVLLGWHYYLRPPYEPGGGGGGGA